MKLQKLYKEFKAKEREYEVLENMLENDWENEGLELMVDDYYDNEYYPVYEELVKEVVKTVKCDVATAKIMINNKKFENLMKLTIA